LRHCAARWMVADSIRGSVTGIFRWRITYSECVPVFLPYLSCTQIASRMHSIILSSVWLYHMFPPYVISGMIFGKKKVLKLKCVLWFSLKILSKTFLILRNHEFAYVFM
jgi:hypothetical protein